MYTVRSMEWLFLLTCVCRLTASSNECSLAQSVGRYPALDAEQTQQILQHQYLARTGFSANFNGNRTKHDTIQPAVTNSKNVQNQAYLVNYRNSPCTHCPNPAAPCHPPRIPGLNGQPYCPKQSGGCQCGSIGCRYQMAYNPYWTYPLKPHLNRCTTPIWVPPCRADWWDLFNKLQDIHFPKYERRDNIYSGCNADRYGCLGASYYK